MQRIALCRRPTLAGVGPRTYREALSLALFPNVGRRLQWIDFEGRGTLLHD